MSLEKEAYKKKNVEMSVALVRLLQGFVFQTDKKIWEKILLYQEPIREYFNKLNLYLHLDQEDGYAFLKNNPLAHADCDPSEQIQDEEENGIPSLIRKMPLSFDVSLLCVLLRENLEIYDAKVSDDHRLIIKKNDLIDQMKFFYSAKTDEVKFQKKIEATISKVEDLGFLRSLNSHSSEEIYEVKRVIKAFIDGQKVKEIKEQMLQSISSMEVVQ